MSRNSLNLGPSWWARQFYRLAVRLYPRYAEPSFNPTPEIIVVGDGRAGSYLLKQTRNQHHVSVYWPGRGEQYILGRPAGRVTIDSAATLRLTPLEREVLRQRTLTWGDRAIWLEF